MLILKILGIWVALSFLVVSLWALIAHRYKTAGLRGDD